MVYIIFEIQKLINMNLQFLKYRGSRNLIFCLVLLFLFSLTNDYGISYDEFWYRDIGFSVLNYLGEVFAPDKILAIKETRNLYYMSLKEVLDVAPIGFKVQHTIYSAIEYLAFSNSPKENIFIMRHFLNFLMSSLLFIIFYKILRLRFNKFLATIGLLMIILSPKIFSDFYYNPNDIWAFFSSALITYCSLYFIKKEKLKYFYFLSLVFALAINTRLIFIYLYFLFILIVFIKNKLSIDKQLFKKLFLQLFLFLFFLYLITPQLWINFFGLFETFISQLSFPQDSMVYFWGKYQRSSELPLFYIFIWMLISIPIFYIFLFFVGLFICIFELRKKILCPQNYDLIFILLYLLLPLLAILIMKPNLFNGWRHFYFLNLSILYFSVLGIQNIIKFLKNKKIKNIFLILVVVNLTNIALWMIFNHPYQHVYFNHIGKKYSSNFDLDYWGLSNLNALKFIANLEKNNSSKIKVKAIGDSRIIYAYKIMNNDFKEKISIMKRNDQTDADYYITNFHNGKRKNYYIRKGFKIVHEFKVDDFAINTIMQK